MLAYIVLKILSCTHWKRILLHGLQDPLVHAFACQRLLSCILAEEPPSHTFKDLPYRLI